MVELTVAGKVIIKKSENIDGQNLENEQNLHFY